MKRIVHLEVSVKGVKYALATLSFNLDNPQMSYHFHYPEYAPEKHLYCETGQSLGRLDHITWHKNEVHIRRRNKVVEEVEYADGTFLENPPRITPLLLDSIFIEENEMILRRLSNEKLWPNQESVSKTILELDAPKSFSVLFLLVPKSLGILSALAFQFEKTPDNFIRSPMLADLWNLNHPFTIIREIWEGWELLILPSLYVRTMTASIPAELGKCYRMPDYKRVDAALTNLLLQTNEALHREMILDLLQERIEGLQKLKT